MGQGYRSQVDRSPGESSFAHAIPFEISWMVVKWRQSTEKIIIPLYSYLPKDLIMFISTMRKIDLTSNPRKNVTAPLLECGRTPQR
eukprot:COSAG05_NODE_1158_length_5680_cov_39.705787_4_plen_86_part_00